MVDEKTVIPMSFEVTFFLGNHGDLLVGPSFLHLSSSFDEASKGRHLLLEEHFVSGAVKKVYRC